MVDINWILTAIVVSVSLRLIWVDFKKLEIELESLFFMALILITQSVLQDNGDTLIRLICGILFFVSLILIIKFIPGLAKIGAGDPPLIGVIAFMVTPYIVTWSVIAAICIAITCATYSIKRGKRLFKSMFPAAPPLLISALMVYLPIWGV